MGNQSHFRTSLAVALAVAGLSAVSLAQSVNPVTLYSDETLHWDAFAIKISGACKVSSDARTFGIGVSQIRLLDGAGSSLAAIRPSSLDGNYYMGGGWHQIEGNPATAPSSYRWADGAAPLTTFYYAIPAAARQVEITALAPPCGTMSVSVSLNGVSIGTFSVPAGSSLRAYPLNLPATIRRFVHLELTGAGPLAIGGIDWLDNQAAVVGTTTTSATLASAAPVAELDATPPAGALSWRVRLSSASATAGTLLVSFNGASAHVFSYAAGQTAIVCATTDPLTRQADKKTRTDGWGDDFNARNSFRASTSNQAYPTLQSNGATVAFVVPAGTNQSLSVDMFTAAPMPVADYPYLSVRLKASKGTIYYIRPSGLDSSGQIRTVYQQNISDTEALPGTGDWQTHSISLKRLISSVGIASASVTEIRLDIVNQGTAAGAFELDWIRVDKAFQPDPGNCAATETDFTNHLDDDCNGLLDQDDELAWTQYTFGRKLVMAYHYSWFGTPFGPSKAWINWAGNLSNFSDPTTQAVAISAIDPTTFDAAYPGKRNLASRYYPLDYRRFPSYIPPANNAFRYDIYGGADYYDNLDSSFAAAQVALAAQYGIDGFISERGPTGFYAQRFAVARDAVGASAQPFSITPLYDFYYRQPSVGLFTERTAADMASDLVQLNADASTNDRALRFAGRPAITAPFLSTLVTPDKWQSVITQAAAPDSFAYNGTVTTGAVQAGAKNLVTFTFSRADQPGTDKRYLSVAFRTIAFLDKNLHELSRLTFGTAQARSQLLAGWSIDETENDGPFVWAAGTQKTATLNIAIPDGAVFLQLECHSLSTQNTTTVKINSGSIASFDALENWSDFTFRLTAPASSTASKAPFALFLDSTNVADGYLSYGAHTKGSRIFVSNGYPVLATVDCGYDDTRIRVPGQITDRQDGAHYRQAWEQALSGNPDLIAINTWNEWSEGTNIEPSVEFGYKYVELTLTYSLMFKGQLTTSALPSQLGLTVTRYSVQGTATDEIDFNTASPSAGTSVVFAKLPAALLRSLRVTANGQSYSDWTPDPTGGTLTIRLPGSQTSFTIGPAGTSSPAPVIGSIFNSPSGSPTIAQNTWISIQGTNLATTTRTWRNSDFIGNKLPVQVDGVSVMVNGTPAYLAYVSPTQVNVLTPADGTVGPVQVQITRSTSISAPATVQMRASSLAFFTFTGGYVAAVHADGTYVGPATLYPGQSSPARPGETVVLFGNGFGGTVPQFPDGQLVTQALPLPALPVISIGGTQAQVAFAGLTGPGLYQFNVVIPAALPNGDAALVAHYGGADTQADVSINVQK